MTPRKCSWIRIVASCFKQRMAKHCQLSTDRDSKRFNFMLNDENLEQYTQCLAPVTVAANTQKCIKLFDASEEASNTELKLPVHREVVAINNKRQFDGMRGPSARNSVGDA